MGIATDPSNLTTLAEIVGTYIEKSFFGFQQPDLVLYKDAKKYPQARGVGNVARFPIMRPSTTQTKTNETGTGSTAEGSNPTPEALTIDSREVTMSKLDHSFEVTYEAWQTAIEALAKQVGEELRKNWDVSLNYNLLSVLSARGNRSRIDRNNAYQYGSTVDSATATGLTDATLEALYPSDDDLSDAIAIITGGPGAGQVREITDYTASGGVCVVGTWDTTPTSASTWKLVRTDGIDSNNAFGTDAFFIGRGGLKCYKAPRMGGRTIFRCCIDDINEQDLLGDEVFQKTGMYGDSAKVDDGFIGRWLGIEVGVTSEVWTEDAGTMNTFAAAGDVHTAWFYAKDSFGCVAPVKGGEGIGNVEFMNIMTPDSNNPTLAFTLHSYRGYFASAIPFGLLVHGVCCGSKYENPGDVHA